MRNALIFEHLKFPAYQYHEYPKVMYHPEGKTKVTEPGIIVRDAQGVARIGPDGTPMMVGQRVEIETIIVDNAEEEKIAKTNGWHANPETAKAFAEAKRTGEPVQMPTLARPTREQELERELAEAKAQLAQLTAETEAKAAMAKKAPMPVLKV